MDIDEAFKKFTEHKKVGGRHEIDCTKGLWGVSAPSKDEAMTEAKHYFWQYYRDGEYG